MTEDRVEEAEVIPESNEEVMDTLVTHTLDHLDLLHGQQKLLLVTVSKEQGGRLVIGIKGVVLSHICERVLQQGWTEPKLKQRKCQ